MSIRSLALGAAILAALFFGGWLYGLHQYRQGVNAEKVNAVLSQISIRICFDGKVALVKEGDFCAINE